MSLATSLHNALSGLRATNMGVAVTSDNLSNALTPGFRRRTLSMSSFSTGGVRVGAVDRYANAALMGQIFQNTSQLSHSGEQKRLLEGLYNGVGLFSEEGTLNARFSDLKNRIVSAISEGQEHKNLDLVFHAQSIVQGLDHTRTSLSTQKFETSKHLNQSIEDVNGLLTKIHELNNKIVNSRGFERASLEDMRDEATEKLSQLVPVHVQLDKSGRYEIQTENGIMLLSSKPRQFELDQGELYLKSSANSPNRQKLSNFANGPITGGILGAQYDYLSRELPNQIAKLSDIEADVLALPSPYTYQTPTGPIDIPLFTQGSAGEVLVNPVLTGKSTTYNGQSITQSAVALKDSAVLEDMIKDVAEIEAKAINWGANVAANLKHWESENTSAGQVKSSLDAAFAREGVSIEEQAHALSVLQNAYEANAQVLKMIDEMQKTLLRI